MEANRVTKSVTTSPFLGNVVEICIVTSCCNRTIAGLESLGIGPFQKFEFNSRTVTNHQYRGQPSNFELKVAFATHGNIVWEIMQPVAGPSIMREFLDTHGEGIHHVAFDCQHVPQHQRREEFERRGYQLVQSGIWHGKKGTCEFMFFDTENTIGTCFESYTFSDDWEDPEEAA
ncbi:methylmalonyl- epimerase [Trichoderma arundinaceum]|uniref:Methylmalonyl-epimerase n=1 Tax=Trichoderma arundinaceum TaxID=490622 RepID=A0A395NSB2_TRIAR|nr:methylmalonyl- epimerase [Trichoderma arundinaceum]